MRNAVIIIPAYKPTTALIEIVNDLKSNNFHKIIVVDDGSGAEYSDIFVKVKSLGPIVAVHPQNKGKGEALKTGFREAREKFDIADGVITVDADNQHHVSDVVKISEALKINPNALVIGSRDFDSDKIPLKSLFGNKLTSIVFKLSTGVTCKDTQTGLRGLHANMLDMALSTHGSRYEYEYNFLTEAVEEFDLVSVPIKTIYIDDNKNSHFRPIRDSLLIYQRPIKFFVSSLIGFLSDIVIFYLLTLLLSFSATENVIIATVIARIASGVINYTINKKSVFRLENKLISSSLKYLFIFLLIMSASAIGTAGLSLVITSTVLAKIIVDIILFIFSYNIQKNWVFADKINTQKASRIWKSCTFLFLLFYVGFTVFHRFLIPQNIVVVDDIYTEEPAPSVGSSDILEEDKAPTQDIVQTEDLSPEDKDIITEPIITDTSYTDENISVTIETIREFDTDIYIAEVILSDSSYLKTGLAEGSFGTNVKEKTSEIAEDNNAILAINGDYYGFRDYGYVMRNGYLYRDIATEGGNEALVIYQDGNMEIVNESDITASELQANGAEQIFSFGPGLISDGEIQVDENSQVQREDASNPRTAIAMVDENHYIFMVADGRTDISEGLSLQEMAIVLSEYGCEVAYNLDGGGSATMIFMGELINNPTTNGRDIKERSVSDIVYIG